ncbi:hypothetical protein QEH56_01295 [Pelagicoccus enzymogenes]|uniref:hypothetical protein n=1 Tax=Pelagicoccus enzymogenes TaxID=2773457 RepID=UPI00280CE803|nr:hypothetical protein [Pelagicoccus enzymogenes]MDQ8196758.1 hypothetical protein [Pelagicoccus enzymogenes]
MSKLTAIHQSLSLRIVKVCLSCFGIAGTAVLMSGVLKMGVLNNDRKIDHGLRFLRPLSDAIQQAAEQLLY